MVGFLSLLFSQQSDGSSRQSGSHRYSNGYHGNDEDPDDDGDEWNDEADQSSFRFMRVDGRKSLGNDLATMRWIDSQERLQDRYDQTEVSQNLKQPLIDDNVVTSEIPGCRPLILLWEKNYGSKFSWKK